MSVNKSFVLRSFVLGTVALAAVAAHADTLTSRSAVSPAATVFDMNVTPHPVSGVGAFAITNSGDANAALNGSFTAFCIEPAQSISISAAGSGDSSYSAAFTTSSAVVQRLFDLDYATAGTTAAKAAAFGLALQELTFETSGTYSLTSGNFARSGANPFSSQALVDANTLIASVVSAPDAATHMKLMEFSSASSQDLLAAVPTTPVPEPETYALMLGGLGALGFMARRRARG